MVTAAYTAQADSFGRSVQWVVELTLDRCSLTYGTSGDSRCGVAADLGDGARCFYTWPTCQNPTAFDRTTRTLRFCKTDVLWPDDANPAYPLLKDIVTIPQRIDPAKLLTWPQQVKATFNLDYLPLPIDLDKTIYNSGTAGEFWRNLLARNRNYVGRTMKVYRGFYASGYAWSDFAQVGPSMKITMISIDGGECTITGEAKYAELDNKQVPYPISDDNTLQTEMSTELVTSAVVLDASEYPDPAALTRNAAKVFIKIENEIMRVSARDTGTDTLTVVRGQWGTTAVGHAAGKKVNHVLCVGTNNGASAPGADNPISVLQDLLEWAGIAAADVNTTSFDLVESSIWFDDDTLAVRTKPAKISKLAQNLREARGLVIFVDSAGKYACTAMAPTAAGSEIDFTEDNIVQDSLSVKEDEEHRINQVSFYYDPATEDASTTSDFDLIVKVIDTDLQDPKMFGDVKNKEFLDSWTDPAYPTSGVRNIARRLITRLRYGAREVEFDTELKSDIVNVGDEITIQHGAILDQYGAKETRAYMITGRKEISSIATRFTAVDLNYGGNFMRIGPDTMSADWSTATDADKLYGYWGDANNQLGTEKSPGYILF